MSECPECATATTKRHHCGYFMGCQGCRARLLASSHAFYMSELTHKVQGDYKAALAEVGAGSVEEAHKLVREWRDRLDALKESV